ncbi:pyridoxamine 5'-phosphate oxidase family protein [Sphingomonas piscis]|uniref:Pyridoxamine 5'-phosphate oxidase family protein n=1 Tax=Sphingomonas piscis TaxID=2714943 RepID=A0A6G7YPK7_9SPHN|nr:pyridoxamine 5'-phosphate oxidase family protein [Sphingomonas piscis]QIK78675.1 pyridoxamine 5'-phosphate oxidase family protein [Sphingomonas piscis]
MKDKAVRILDENRIMALATVRPDGWPQATMVSYANDELVLYFVVSPESQKFKNICWDDRVSIAIGRDFHHPGSIRGLSIAARASEVRDAAQRRRAIDQVIIRHPALKRLQLADGTAVMRADCSIISILDYAMGFGHTDLLAVKKDELTQLDPARDDDWGFGNTPAPLKDF